MCPIVAFADSQITDDSITASTEVDSVISTQETAVSEILDSGDIPGEETQSIWVTIVFPLFLEFLGAFLGVFLALWLESRGQAQQAKEVNENLYLELIGIGKELEKRLNNEDYDYYQYVTPVWDINMAAGNLSLLTQTRRKKKNIHQEYIEIYAAIHYAQTLERDYIQGKLLPHSVGSDRAVTNYLNTIDKARKREAKAIYEKIKKLPKEVK